MSNEYGYWPERKAAAYLSISQSTLQKLRHYGGGPRYYKVRGRVLYWRPDLDGWVQQNFRANTSEVPA